MKWLILIAAGFSLASCASTEQIAALDDQQCASYGAKQGSDAYVSCRTQLATARINAQAAADAAGTIGLAAQTPASRR